MTESLGEIALLNERTVAKRLGCGVKVLQKWRVTGTGPAYIKVGSLVRYEPKAIHDFVESRRRTSTSQSASK